ncbi:MAG: hypothetical protein EA367_02930 [Leptolyngbya sp. DLM2.Bin15]|nr:MAG: hypothetical protein EA367_02930 [Leptolyngbya sp. DLM2.Bin15]
MPNSSTSLALQFCTYQPDIDSRRKRVDRNISPTAEILIDDTICQNPDVWGRYFLLIFWFWQVPETASFRYLEQAIRAWQSLCWSENAHLLDIHHHILSQQQHPQAQRFFNNPLDQARHLLIIYLQPKCVAAAKKWFAKPEEGFGIALEQVSDLGRLLKRFDLGLRHTTLRAYAEQRLQGKIRDHRVKEEGTKRYTSGYAKLRYSTKTAIRYALQSSGLNDSQIRRIRLVLKSFAEIYTTKQVGKQELPPPSPEQLLQMSDRCNQRASSLKISPEFTPQDIQTILDTTIHALKHHPLNRDRPLVLTTIRGADDEEQSLLDTIEDKNATGDLEDLMLQEVRDYLRELVDQVFMERSTYEKNLLRLRDGLGLVQREIKDVLYPGSSKDQSTVSRHIKALKQKFCHGCIQEIQQTYPDVFSQGESHDVVIAQLNDHMTIYLTQYSQKQGQFLLTDIIQQLDASDRQMLVQVQTQPDMSTPMDVLDIHKSLHASFIQAIHRHWDVDFQKTPSLHYRLYDFIDEWLHDCLLSYE